MSAFVENISPYPYKQADANRKIHQRNHDLWSNFDAFGLHLRRRLKDGAHLHFADLGIDSSQAATTETKHGIELVQFMHARGHLLRGHAKFASQRLLRCGIIGQKFLRLDPDKFDGNR